MLIAVDDVRYWHLADIDITPSNVRFGIKRTSLIRSLMSAYDPKRTLQPSFWIRQPLLRPLGLFDAVFLDPLFAAVIFVRQEFA